MILANHGILSSSGGVSFDADALAFITAASITDNTQKTAVNTLVTDLKAYNIWTKMKAIYPFVGGSATSHKWNLKDARDLDAAFRLTFNGGWTHSSTGALPNGTTGYANTNLLPSSILLQNDTHISYYSRTNTSSGGVDFGSVDSGFSGALYATIKDADGKTYFRVNRSSASSESIIVMGNTNIFYMINRTSSTNESLFINNTKSSFVKTSTGLSTFPISLGCLNVTSTNQYFASKEAACVTIGNGLSDTEAANLYAAVQAFNTTLSRQV